GSALAPNVQIFIAARFIGGVGIGVSTVVAPMYIAEIAPPADRGRLAGMFQFNIVFGIVVAFLSNALLDKLRDHAWRWMLCVVAFFNQMSGINAILYFAPRIFQMTGLGARAALLQSVGIGITNLIFTFVGLWLIDRLGRRTLLTIGSYGYIASLGLCAWAFFTHHYAIVPACIFAFI